MKMCEVWTIVLIVFCEHFYILYNRSLSSDDRFCHQTRPTTTLGQLTVETVEPRVVSDDTGLGLCPGASIYSGLGAGRWGGAGYSGGGAAPRAVSVAAHFRQPARIAAW